MSSQAAAAPAVLRRAGTRIATARDRLLAVRPLYVLSTLIGVQWAAIAGLALTVRHNGWIYYMGGDQLWHYTGAYQLGRAEIAPTYVGVGWSAILTPISWLAGPDLVSALPAIVLLSTLVLVPLALLCVYGIGERIGGRLFGYWAALLWVVLPFAGIRYVLTGYHAKYTEQTLPQVLGLGAMSDLPSVVALLVGAYLCLRALDEGHWLWAAGAGFAVSYALAIKPSNAVFLVAPAVLFLAFRRSVVLPFVGGLAPPLVLLALWKVRGFGKVPAFGTAAPERRVALGIDPLSKYTDNNSWAHLHTNLLQIREHLWSERLLEFLAIGGIVALCLRSRRAGAFVGSWFIVFILFKGTYVNARVEDGSFWRLLLPAFPAFVLLVASVPLLVPGVRLRPPPLRPRRISRRSVIAGLSAVFAVLVLFPLVLVAAAKPVRVPHMTAVRLGSTLVPVWDDLGLRAEQHENGVLLTWRAERPGAGRIFYRIYRTPAESGEICSPAAEGTACPRLPGDLWCRTVPRAPDNCVLSGAAVTLGTTRDPAWLDRPEPGTWTYRVAVSANWRDDPELGDAYVFTPAATISAP